MIRWDRVGLDEAGKTSCGSDDQRAKSGLRSESAGDEHWQERRRFIE